MSLAEKLQTIRNVGGILEHENLGRLRSWYWHLRHSIGRIIKPAHFSYDEKTNTIIMAGGYANSKDILKFAKENNLVSEANYECNEICDIGAKINYIYDVVNAGLQFGEDKND